MKKAISCFLVVILCMSLTVSAMAADEKPDFSIDSDTVWIDEAFTMYEDPATSGRHQYYFSGSRYSFDYSGYNLVHSDADITFTNEDSNGTMFLRIYFFLNNGEGEYIMTGEYLYTTVGGDTKYSSQFYVDERGELGLYRGYVIRPPYTAQNLSKGESISLPVSKLIEKAADLGTEDAYFCLVPMYRAEGAKTQSYGDYIFRVDNEKYAELKGSSPSKEEIPTEEGNPFTDVPNDVYYHDAVLWAYENNITNGTSATTFSPDSTCTRGQVVTFLWRACGNPEPETTNNPFTDIKEEDYYYKAVLWAVEKGITIGTSATTFSPADTCTSGQVVTLLWRANGSPVATTDGAEYYSEAVAWAKSSNLLEGTSATFDPKNACPRADIVTYIYRATN